MRNSNLVFQTENVVIDQATRTLMANYTGITEAHLKAMQKFLNAIGGLSGSIWSKIEQLYMPVFANAAGQIFWDVKQGAAKYPPQAVTSSNVGDYYSATYGTGATRITALSNGNGILFKKQTDVSTAFVFGVLPTNSTVKVVFGKGNCSESVANFKVTVSGTDVVESWPGARGRTYVYRPNKGLSSTFDVYHGGVKLSAINGNRDYTNSDTVNSYLSAWGNGQHETTGLVFQVQGFGQGLTSEEAATLSSALETLKDSL